MCLVAVAWRAHPRYPLIIAGNRDESHDRPAAPADWWPDEPGILAGRDLVAGGTWLGVSRSGRVSVIINQPERPPAPEHDRSRGQLVRDFLAADTPAAGFVGAVQREQQRYAGFCLVVGSMEDIRGFISPRGPRYESWQFPTGVMALGNTPPEIRMPKVRWLEEQLTAALAGDDPAADDILALLQRREPVPALAGEPGGLIGSAPFIVGATYGTRASTLVLRDNAGTWRFIEQRFATGGKPAGETRLQFSSGVRP